MIQLFHEVFANTFCLMTTATTTDVERSFSLGSLTVTKRRHALSDESVRAGTVLASWATVPGVIPEAEIVEVFKNKCRRTKAAGAGAYVYDDLDDGDDTSISGAGNSQSVEIIEIHGDRATARVSWSSAVLAAAEYKVRLRRQWNGRWIVVSKEVGAVA